jgi:hypothetical protein
MLAKNTPVVVQTFLIEAEELLHSHGLTLHARYLADVYNLARAINETGQLKHEVDSGGDLLPDGPTGRSKPAIRTMFSTRARASRGEFAWTVVREPSWPVFMA